MLHSAAAANPGGVPSLVLPEAQESTELTLSSSAAIIPAATTKDDVTGAMLEPSVLNKQWVSVGSHTSGCIRRWRCKTRAVAEELDVVKGWDSACLLFSDSAIT